MGMLEGKINGTTLEYEPSRLAVLLSRLCHETRPLEFKETEKRKIRGRVATVLQFGPIEYNGDTFCYQLAVQEKELQDPLSERIEIKPYQAEFRIRIERAPTVSKWKDTKVLVRKIYNDGHEEGKRRFTIHNLNGIEHYVHSLEN